MVLRFIGFMYLLEPDAIRWTMILFAFSDGWNGSQNAYKSLLGHKFDAIVQRPMPLYGPCPQHAIFEVTNPVNKIKSSFSKMLFLYVHKYYWIKSWHVYVLSIYIGVVILLVSCICLRPRSKCNNKEGNPLILKLYMWPIFRSIFSTNKFLCIMVGDQLQSKDTSFMYCNYSKWSYSLCPIVPSLNSGFCHSGSWI